MAGLHCLVHRHYRLAPRVEWPAARAPFLHPQALGRVDFPVVAGLEVRAGPRHREPAARVALFRRIVGRDPGFRSGFRSAFRTGARHRLQDRRPRAIDERAPEPPAVFYGAVERPAGLRAGFRAGFRAGAGLRHRRSGGDPAPGALALRPVPPHAHRAGQRPVRQADPGRGVEVGIRHAQLAEFVLAELVLAGHRPQRAPVGRARAPQARKLLLFPDDQIHEPGRAPVDRRVPGLFEARQQDPRLRPLRFAPQNADLAHPRDDLGPLQHCVAGLPRRRRGIAGPARGIRGIAGGHEMPAERLLPARQDGEVLRHGIRLGPLIGMRHDNPPIFAVCSIWQSRNFSCAVKDNFFVPMTKYAESPSPWGFLCEGGTDRIPLPLGEGPGEGSAAAAPMFDPGTATGPADPSP